jgi:hypothetical protein
MKKFGYTTLQLTSRKARQHLYLYFSAPGAATLTACTRLDDALNAFFRISQIEPVIGTGGISH